MLAGFETPTSGQIILDGQDLADQPPYERPMNMMFQSYALFPHLTVWENIAFGLKREGLPKAEVASRVDNMLKLVQLGKFAQRKPHQLSGGQQQRVALARSLAKQPLVLLLDEPLGALDKKLREQTQIELVNIIEQVGVTCVMVTHDQEEAMTMASRIAIMSEGRFLQVGAPGDIYETPATRFVADFIGNVNLMEGTLTVDEPDHVIIDCADCRHYVGHGITGTEGMAVTVALRPEKIHLSRDKPADEFNAAQRHDQGDVVLRQLHRLPRAAGQRRDAQDQPGQREPAPRGRAHLGRQRLGPLVALRAHRADVMKALKALFSSRAPVIGVPYGYLLVFFLLPFLVVFRISVSEMEVVTFKDLITWQDGVLQLSLKFSNYLFILEDPLYVSTYLSSLKYAAATTVMCLFIGYPFAYFMARAKPTLQPALLMLVMLPFWTSFLLRVYAWKGLLSENGWVSDFLIGSGLDQVLFALGLIPAPGKLMNTPFSLVLGMTYTYLPFMILPLFGNLAKLDLRLLEAAADLGASPWTAFWKITVPLSKAGIIAGAMLVFIPCVGEFVIPELLGGPETLMIGRVMWDEFFSNNDWPMASSVAVVMVLLIIVPLAIFNKYQAESQETSK